MIDVRHDLKKEKHGLWRCARCGLAVFTSQAKPDLPGPCSPARAKKRNKKKHG